MKETYNFVINLGQTLCLLVMILLTFRKEFAFHAFTAENLQPLPVAQFTEGETDAIAIDWQSRKA